MGGPKVVTVVWIGTGSGALHQLGIDTNAGASMWLEVRGDLFRMNSKVSEISLCRRREGGLGSMRWEPKV